MEKRVRVGEEFEADVVITEASERSVVLRVVLGVGTTFLIGAAVLGLTKGEYGYLAAVWGTIAPLYGGIAGYYFAERKSDK